MPLHLIGYSSSYLSKGYFKLLLRLTFSGHFTLLCSITQSKPRSSSFLLLLNGVKMLSHCYLLLTCYLNRIHLSGFSGKHAQDTVGKWLVCFILCFLQNGVHLPPFAHGHSSTAVKHSSIRAALLDETVSHQNLRKMTSEILVSISSRATRLMPLPVRVKLSVYLILFNIKQTEVLPFFFHLTWTIFLFHRLLI